MAKHKQTKKQNNKKNSSKLTARQVKQIARAAEKKAKKKKETEKRAKEAQRLQDKKERLKNLSQQQAKNTDYQRLMGLLLTKITQGGHNPNTVLNDTTILKAFLREIVNAQPSLKEAADNLLVETKKRL